MYKSEISKKTLFCSLYICKMNKILIAICVCCVFTQHSFSQVKIDTDRPDQTESAVLTPKGFFQAEVGFNFEKDNGLKSLVHPTILWKYGINKRFEFRLITEFVSEETPIIIPAGNKYNSGIAPVQIGGRVALWEEKGILPNTALIFHVGIPGLSSTKFKPPHFAPNFRFSMAHSITENIGLGYNVGAEWDGFDNTAEWIYTFAPGISFCKNWYSYIELFGGFKKNQRAEHSIDGGLAYFTSNNTKIDISAGYGLTESAMDWYTAIGFSFRFAVSKKAITKSIN